MTGNTAVAEVCTALEKMESKFKMALPAHIPADKFVRTAINAVQMNPELLKADRRSLYMACQQSAADGLVLDNREAALVMFGNKCQYMPMIGGVLKKMRQSKEVSTIAAECVYENDEWDYRIVNGVPQLNHAPCFSGDRGKVKLVYAVAVLSDGGIMSEVMTMEDINKVMGASRSKNGPWKTWFDQMAKKSALRRLAKRLPQSSDIEVVYRDDNMYSFNDEPAAAEPERDVTPAPTNAESVILSDDPEEDDALEGDII